MSQRMTALLIMLIPGIMSVYGVKLMRDAIFTTFEINGFSWGMFSLGLLLFLAGITFIGGFIAYRDRKRKYGPRFKDDLSEDLNEGQRLNENRREDD